MIVIGIEKRLAELVSEAGGRAFYVGGFVRDRLRGMESADYDIEVHGITPEVLEGILDSLGERLEMGRSFGIYGLRGEDIDIAMPRTENATGRGHRDFQVFVDPFIGYEKAARRRDFTVNAMMEDVLTGEVLDFYGGREDLEKGILRHVCDESFAEDPLRVLRLAQFAARFGFTPAAETKALCRTIDLSSLSRERVFEETKKAFLKAEKPSVYFGVLRSLGQLHDFFPELESLIGVPQSPVHHAEGDVWNHTMLVLDEAAKLRDRAKNPLGLMFSALVHDFGKAVSTVTEPDGRIRSIGHESTGLPLVDSFAARLTSDKALIAYMKNMTGLHMRPNSLASQNAKVKATNKLFDEALCPSDLVLLAIADGLGKLPRSTNEEFLYARLAAFRETIAKPAVMGRDLIEAGLKPGGQFSELLAFAHKLHLAGIDKEEALKQTLAMAKKKEEKK